MPLSPNVRGSLFMVVSVAGFTTNDAITKTVSAEMNFGQLLMLRGCFAVVLIAALAASRGALRPPRVLAIPTVGLRIFGEVGGSLCFLAAITHLPLANTSAIFQSLPLAITLAAALLFKEQVGWRRWVAIAAGFVGVLIIVRPGMAAFDRFSIFALIAVAFSTLRDLATKRIPQTIPTLFITLVTTITVSTAGAALMIPLGGWTQPSGRAIALLALSAVLILVGYHFVILALREGDISAVAPFRYTALLWAIVLGYLIFGDAPDGPMLFGAALIVASGLYTFYRERVASRSRVAATSGPPPEA